jgi:AcrR family transcriptional regulator
MPTGLELLWEGPKREPKRGLSVERIVAAAIGLADADGLEAVSMSRVAERLGFTAMSLYRHVESKDDLLVLMQDHALGPPPPLDPSVTGWRARLERWCTDMLTVLNRHPWWLQIPVSPPPPTPSQVAWFERGLAAMEDTELEEPEKAAVILTLNGLVYWEARLNAELDRDDESLGVYVSVMSSVDPERFPAVHRAVQAGIFEDDSRDTDYAFSLQLALDGVERLVRMRAASPG